MLVRVQRRVAWFRVGPLGCLSVFVSGWDSSAVQNLASFGLVMEVRRGCGISKCLPDGKEVLCCGGR